MAEISTLKLKLTAVEKDRIDFEERYKDTEVRGHCGCRDMMGVIVPQQLESHCPSRPDSSGIPFSGVPVSLGISGSHIGCHP